MPQVAAPPAADATGVRIDAALAGFVVWLERFGAYSHDHYDVWASRPGRAAKAIYYRRGKLGLPLVGPFLAVHNFLPQAGTLLWKPTRFPIADAHYAMGFLKLACLRDREANVERARAFLDALEESRCRGFEGVSWGYPFDWETCAGTFRAGVPLITSTPYGYEAFLLASEVTGEQRYRDIARGAVLFGFEEIASKPVGEGMSVCSYGPFDHRRVVNANAYRAFLLIDGGRRFGRDDWIAAGEENLRFVLEYQREDGSWPYAIEDGRDDFVDNFHTCFVLKNLHKVWLHSQSPAVAEAVEQGYTYYRRDLLDGQGQPIPFARTQRPTLFRRDLYDYAEGINLALSLSEHRAEARTVLEGLVRALLDSWMLPDGHFVTRELLVGRNTVPYHRWAQSQTFHALARYRVEAA